MPVAEPAGCSLRAPPPSWTRRRRPNGSEARPQRQWQLAAEAAEAPTDDEADGDAAEPKQYEKPTRAVSIEKKRKDRAAKSCLVSFAIDEDDDEPS